MKLNGKIGVILAGALAACAVCVSLCVHARHRPAADSTAEAVSAPVQKWQPAAQKAVIVLGEGYTDSLFTENLTAEFSDAFGLEADGGLVSLLIYPEMFSNGGGRTPIRVLPELLAEKNIRVLVFVGAPEKTHEVIAGLRSAGAEYPVLSFFPQDDVLGTEWAATLVYDGDPAFFAASEDRGILFLDEMPVLLESVLTHLDAYDEAARSGSPVAARAALFVPDGWSLSPYVDPETSLKAANHFVLKKRVTDYE